MILGQPVFLAIQMHSKLAFSCASIMEPYCTLENPDARENGKVPFVGGSLGVSVVGWFGGWVGGVALIKLPGGFGPLEPGQPGNCVFVFF